MPTPGDIAPGTSVVAPAVTPPDSLPSAPAMVGEIRYLPNRDSARLFLPVVAGVQDYRVYALTAGVTVRPVGGGTQVDGAIVHCAGLRQHNLCDEHEALDFGPNFFIPPCNSPEGYRTPPTTKEVLRIVQLDGLTAATDIVVEAIDALCPFPGAEGVRHTDLTCVNEGQPVRDALVNGQIVRWETCPATFPIRTEAEIRADYGSLIVNGHGAVPPASGQSPWKAIGLPAPARAPGVLARAVVRVTPTGTATLPPGFTAGDFFEDFADASDQPRKVIANGAGTLVAPDANVSGTNLSQSSKLNFYNHSSDASQMYVARGTLRSVFADGGQDIMGSNVMIPRRTFALPATDDGYVHVTVEVPTNATQRRYWIFHACGAAEPGQTLGTGPEFAADGALAKHKAIVYGSGFMDPDGGTISFGGWNCLQLVPRNGSYYDIEGGATPRAETDIRVVTNRAVPGFDAGRDIGTTRTVTIEAPDQQFDSPATQGTWYRTWDANHQINGVMLDDEMFIEQRTRIDIFFNRGRVVLYANGQQKLCNDFPDRRLTMAEAEIGVGHVLYHSSAERSGFFRNDFVMTGQYQYLKNLPFIDQRSFDNFGVREHAALPAGFEEGQCYASR